jgi:hypothetical protein
VTVSQPASKSASAVGGVLVQKPKAGVYTVLLALSLVAILIGIAFLYARLNKFDFKQKPTGLSAAPTHTSAPAHLVQTRA